MLSRPKKVPRYVEVAESAMRGLFGLDLWRDVSRRNRIQLLITACDAETEDDPLPEDVEVNIEFAVYDKWHAIRPKSKRNK